MEANGTKWGILDQLEQNAPENSPSDPQMLAETAEDALLISLKLCNELDPQLMGDALNRPPEGVMEELRAKGRAYQDPDQWQKDPLKGWVTADRYLRSGNLYDKWESAKKACRHWKERFRANVEALEAVMPKKVIAAEKIYISLGMTWIPPDIYGEFLNHLHGREYALSEGLATWDEAKGRWKVSSKYQGSRGIARYRWGTPNYPTHRIMEARMNKTPLPPPDKNSKISPKETAAARICGEEMDDEFRRWAFEDEFRSRRLRILYYRTFCTIVNQRCDGNYLPFTGKVPDLDFYPHQKNAVARTLQTRNCLWWHGTGSGKTATMAGAVMELRRLKFVTGTALIVSPNHLVEQTRKEFLRFYPNAKVLAVDGKAFSSKKQQEILERIRNGGWDAVILGDKAFGRIPFSSAYQYRIVETELREVNSQPSPDKRRQKALQEKLLDLAAREHLEQDKLFFEDLNVEALFVDEAHNFKNIPLDSAPQLRGISSGNSAKCRDMLSKVRYVQAREGWVVFATATPIPNSVSDLYTMMKYLQPQLLRTLKLDNFLAWANQFGEVRSGWEPDVDTRKVKRVERFVRFHNLPELSCLLGEVTDFHKTGEEGAAVIPPVRRHVQVVPLLPELEGLLDEISERADRIHRGEVDPEEDNFFKLISYARALALDPGLVGIEDANRLGRPTKVTTCAREVARIYRENQARRGTQLVFCDLSTPKKGQYNVYDQLAMVLTQRYHIPREEIAFIQDYTTAAQRESVFAKVRRGEVRILLGSTPTMGTGVNVQDRLVAIHHLDTPWRPADLIQQRGRNERPGHLWMDPTDEYTYPAEGTLDVYMWQVLENKQRFMSQPLDGTAVQRSVEEVDELCLEYAEIKALAAGNGQLKELLELENQVRRLQILENKERELCRQLEEQIHHYPARRKDLKERAQRLKEDSFRYRNHRRPMDGARREAVGRSILTWDGKTPIYYQGFALEKGNVDTLYLNGLGRYPFRVRPEDTGADCVARMDRLLGSLKKREEDARADLEQMDRDWEDWQEELDRLEHSNVRWELEELEQQVNDLREKLERRSEIDP